MQNNNIIRLIEGSNFKPLKIQQRGTEPMCVLYEYFVNKTGNVKSLEKKFIMQGLKHDCKIKVEQLAKSNPLYLHVN